MQAVNYIAQLPFQILNYCQLETHTFCNDSVIIFSDNVKKCP